METLTFRPARRQLFVLTALTVALALVTAAVLLSHCAAGVNLPVKVFSCGIAAAVCRGLRLRGP
jgi:hypothetical protein